jgi:hypothetical protein
MTRLARAWGGLEPEQRLAGLAALGLLVTMFLPWYELQSLNRRSQAIYSHSISAFGDVSFVEAAVFLVAAGVLALLFARAERRDFHMPGSDGAVVMAGGGWATLLIFYRVFSRPDGHGYPVGIQWGFFLAFVAAGLLTYAGWRMRASAAPEPPLVRRPRSSPASPAHTSPAQAPDPAQDLTTVEPAPARAQRSSPVAAHAPSGQDELRTVATGPRASASTPSAPTSSTKARRPRYPPAPSGQLSFEDPPADPERN